VPSADSRREDLPWLVNDSLDAAEREALQAAVDASPELQREQAFLQALRHSIQQQQPEVPLEIGWQRLRRDIRREQHGGVSSRWRLVAVAASLLLVIQSLVIWLPHDEATHYQPLSSAVPRNSLQVRFVDSASLASIQHLLRQQHLRIIDGPSAAGLYRLVGEGDKAKIIAALKRQSGLVAYVQAE